MTTPIEQFFNEVRLLYQSLIEWGDGVHSGRNITMGMRGVLEFLEKNGQETVPNMARERRVTRQRIQSLVDRLRAMQLVTSISNPASKRSPLISLTFQGANTIRIMRREEGKALKLEIDDIALIDATGILTAVRESLEKNPR